MNQEKRVVVIGDGWAALGAVGFLAAAGAPVHWISGAGARLFAVLPALEAGLGAAVWKELASRLGIESGEVGVGSFLREFRNKSFRELPWAPSANSSVRRDASLAARQRIRDDELWAPEARFAGTVEVRFGLDLHQLEEQIREKVLAHPGVKRLEGVPVTGFEIEGSAITKVVLGSGDAIPCERVIYADRWERLIGLEGIPRASLGFARNREPVGAIQAAFQHSTPVGAQVLEGFCCVMHKDPGEEIERRLWGYFSNGGQSSIWTVFLTPDEVEDNHEIAKKLRRMKQTLDRMFVGTDWLPQEQATFSASVQSEHVRFEGASVFASGEPVSKAISLDSIRDKSRQLRGIHFLTDGYGPSFAMEQVADLLGAELSLQVTAIKLEEVESPISSPAS